MNSLGDTVLRSNKRQGAGGGGEQGKQGRQDKFTSSAEGHEEVNGSTSSAKKGKGKKKDKGISVDDAFAALNRMNTREPFISDESAIEPADATTLKMKNGDSDVEIVLEELPPKKVVAPGPNQRVGHDGWMVGGEPAGENKEEEVTDEQGNLGGTHLPQERLRATVARQQDQRAVKVKPLKGKPDAAAKATSKRIRDIFRLTSDEDDDENEEEDLANQSGGQAQAGSAVGQSGEPRSSAREQDLEGGRGNGDGRGADDPGDKTGDVTSGVSSSASKNKKKKQVKQATQVSAAATAPNVFVPLLDAARPPRSELKGVRREAKKQQQQERLQDSAHKKQEQRLQNQFDEMLEELRVSNPYAPAGNEGQVVVWSRKAAAEAVEAVGLTFGRWKDLEPHRRGAFQQAALFWLEANKPKEPSAKCVVGSPGTAAVDVSGRNEVSEEEKRDTDGDGANLGGGVRDGNEEPLHHWDFRGGAHDNRAEGDVRVEGNAGGGGGEGDAGGGGSGSNADDGKEPGAREGEQGGNSGSGVIAGGNEHEPAGPAVKRAKLDGRGGLPRVSRVVRRSAEREESRVERQREQRAKDKPETKVPKAAGRVKQAELELHKKTTRKRERAKQDVRDLIEASLVQRQRQKSGKQLTGDEQQLAEFAKTLSPTKLLGAGFRMRPDTDGDIVLSSDDDAIGELMDETGCGREAAKEALDMSCDWTASGRPSRCKAVLWLKRQQEEEEDEDDDEGSESDSDVECLGVQPPKGVVKPTPAAKPTVSTKVGRAAASAAPPAGGRERSGEDHKNGEESQMGPSADVSKLNRKPVSIKQVSKVASRKSPDASSNESSGSESEESLGSSLPSSSSDSGSSSESCSEDSQDDGTGKKHHRGGNVPSSHRSRDIKDKRASRYVRQLKLALRIDAGWAREIYDECVSRGTTSYDGLLRYFYKTECEKAKGTQKETARPLSVMRGSGDINMTMPTFQLPEWGQGQPPNGGVHFSTLKKMLEAYEKYDKQTNYLTQVTFKGMVMDKLKPNMESKCKLPPTVWLPPKESDWMAVAEGRLEEGGWSDQRFLRRLREKLQPKGRTSYEIYFEQTKLRHKGNDQQLEVALDLWGTNWLAQEREAEQQGKALTPLKMRSYFKKAVDGVARFRRWLEGRKFESCQAWYEVLCRKLHKSLGKAAEADYDRRLEGGSAGYSGDREAGEDRGGGGSWRGGRGGGAYRGGRGRSTEHSGSNNGEERSSHQYSPGKFGKFSERGADARSNAHTAGGTVPPHSGGVEPMHTDGGRGAGARGSPRGGFRGRSDGGRQVLSPERDKPNRQPVNPVGEETKVKLPKGSRWHDSSMEKCRCRDPDCGLRQDVPFCQGCGMHGHERPFCYKSGEPRFNPTGYWCVNRPNEAPIEGLGQRRDSSGTIATARGNLMDASQKQM
jgi:hypothetical protein